MLILSLFYLVYKLVFEKGTNFQHNRFYLLTGIVVSFLMPLLPLNFAAEKIEYIHLSKQVFESTTISNHHLTEAETNPLFDFINSINPIVVVYFTGVLISFGLMFFQLKKIFFIISRGQVVRKDGIKMVFTKEEISPFSFFSTIVLNPELLKQNQVEHILTHENIHISHWHQLDLIMSEMLNIGLWFFPLTRYYGRAMRTNLEFIADEFSLKSGLDKKEYQLNLISLSQQSSNSVLVNNFSKKIIKNRIKMLNKMKTKSRNSVFFMLSIPMMVMVSLGVSVKAQSQNGKIKQVIVLSEEDLNPEEIKVMTKGENDDFVPIDSEKVKIVSPTGLKSDTIRFQLGNQTFDKSKFIKLKDKGGFDMYSDQLIIHTDSVTKEKMMILKNKFNIKGDTLIFTKDGVFGNKDFKFDDYLKNIPDDLVTKFENAKEFSNFSNELFQQKDVSNFQKMFENGKEGIYSKTNAQFYKLNEAGEFELLNENFSFDNDKSKSGSKNSKTKYHIKKQDDQGTVIPEIALKGKKTPKIFIDGKLSDLKSLRKIEAAKTHRIVYMTSNDEANIKKYGKEVKNGILMAIPLSKIKTGKSFQEQQNPRKTNSHSYLQRATDDFETFLIPEISFKNGKTPKIYIDGKISTLQELKKIEAAATHKITYLVSDGEKEINEYGVEVKDGIIIATPKTIR